MALLRSSLLGTLSLLAPLSSLRALAAQIPQAKPTPAVQILLNEASKPSLKPADKLSILQKALGMARSSKDLVGEGRSEIAIGELRYENADPKGGIKFFEDLIPLLKSAQDLDDEATALNDIGSLYMRIGEGDTGVDYLKRALPLYVTTGNKADQANCLSNLGDYYFNKNQYDLSLKAFAESVPLFEESGNKIGEATAHEYIGRSYQALGHTASAVEAYKRALSLFRQSASVAGVGISLNNLGFANSATDPKTAIKFYEQALPLFRDTKSFPDEANTLCNEGAAYDRLGDWDKALACYQAARQVTEKIRNDLLNANALVGIGLELDKKGDRKAAADFAQRGRDLYRSLNNKAGEASALALLAGIADHVGDQANAIQLYLQSNAEYRECNNRVGEATNLNNIGLLYFALGDTAKCLEYYKRCLKVYEDIGNKDWQATVLTNLGALYDRSGNRLNSLESYSRALKLRSEIGNKAGSAATLNNLGAAYLHLGDRRMAIRYLEQALNFARTAKDIPDEASILANLALTYDELGERSKALDLYNQGLRLRRVASDRLGEAMTLNDIGVTYANLKDFEKAKSYYEKSLEVYKSVLSTTGEGACLCNLGSLYYQLKKYPQALELESRALVLLKRGGDKSGEAECLRSIALTVRAQGSKDASIALLKFAVNIDQSLRENIKYLDKGIRESFRGTVEGKYEMLAQWLTQQGRVTEAEEVLNLLKDREFYQYLHTRAATTIATVDLSQVEKDWAGQFNRLGDELASIAAEEQALRKLGPHERSPEQVARLKELGKKLDDAGAAFQRFIADSQKAFRVAGASTERVTDLEASQLLQETLAKLPGKEAAVYTFLTKDGLHEILVLPGLNVVREPHKKLTSDQLDRKVLEFRQALTDPTSDPRSLGAELYDLLVRPIENDLLKGKVTGIMWSLDGALRYVPMWALYDGVTNRFLIEKYPASLFTPHTVAGLTGDLHGLQGAEFGVTRGLSVRGEEFKALVGVHAELRAVHEALGGPPPFEDDAFTLDTFKQTLSDQKAGILHVATHFRLRHGDDEGSYLLLGNGQPLSVRQLKEMAPGTFTGVDLLVLSACETAIGGDADGSEFEGFALLAQLKGAGAVLATLWSVDDTSTSVLMGEFYRLHKAHPQWSKLEALRQAQLAMLSGKLTGTYKPVGTPLPKLSGRDPARWPSNAPKYSHPFYWAPFVLTGNWK